MNMKLFIWIGLAFLGTIVAGVVMYLFIAPTPAPQEDVTDTTLPVGGLNNTGTQGQSTGSQVDNKILMSIQNGKQIVVNDFIHNGVTLKDKFNAGRYLLAGDLEYCWINPSECQAAAVTDYNLYYNSDSQLFTIALIEEPLGQARLKMEQFLMTALGIPRQQLCELNYLVSVPASVNAQYAGDNLGFSFCPGATILP